LERLFALETFGIKLGLENIGRLCDALGHPEQTFLSLHIAGTNGKGSVTAMVHAALVAAGVRAARYTSPHLVHLHERFVVGNAPIDDDTLLQVAADVLDCADELQRNGLLPAPPTFFEATTAMAFEIFRRKHVDVAVIEVGLGGRFDATNVVVPPVGAITSIAFDHEQHLGHTLAEIASEKAGIIKPAMVVVCGSLPPVALDVMKRAARSAGPPSSRPCAIHASTTEWRRAAPDLRSRPKRIDTARCFLPFAANIKSATPSLLREYSKLQARTVSMYRRQRWFRV
jgi:dihydrofolate synthase/folylpolyglutamate synthase